MSSVGTSARRIAFLRPRAIEPSTNPGIAKPAAAPITPPMTTDSVPPRTRKTIGPSASASVAIDASRMPMNSASLIGAPANSSCSRVCSKNLAGSMRRS